MSVKMAILGLLLAQPMHGYLLKRKLSPALSRDKQLNDGVLYPLLGGLERDGLIRKKVETGDGRRKRNTFSVTAKGRHAFQRWLQGDEFEEDEVTYDFFLGHPFLAKCMFFDALPADQVRAKIAAQRASTEAKLAAFRAIRKGMVERSVSPYRVAILDLGMAQQRAKLRWLGKLAELPATTSNQPRSDS